LKLKFEREVSELLKCHITKDKSFNNYFT